MVRRVIGIAISLSLIAGSTSMTTTPTVSEEEECNRNGGWWRPALEICDN